MYLKIKSIDWIIKKNISKGKTKITAIELKIIFLITLRRYWNFDLIFLNQKFKFMRNKNKKSSVSNFHIPFYVENELHSVNINRAKEKKKMVN